jgi:hypothetical protein
MVTSSSILDIDDDDDDGADIVAGCNTSTAAIVS